MITKSMLVRLQVLRPRARASPPLATPLVGVVGNIVM